MLGLPAIDLGDIARFVAKYAKHMLNMVLVKPIKAMLRPTRSPMAIAERMTAEIRVEVAEKKLAADEVSRSMSDEKKTAASVTMKQ